MWIEIKPLALLLNKTPRAIQLLLKNESCHIQSRKKDGKTLELLVSSLPSDWQALLLRAQEIKVTDSALATLTPSAQVIAQARESGVTTDHLAQKLGKRQKQHLAITQKLKQMPPGAKKSEWLQSVASYFDVSVSTVRRVAAEMESYGVVGKPREQSGLRAWDPETVQYMTGYYLRGLREGACSKTTAYKATQIYAQNKGMKIGSRSSAFQLLGEINPLLIKYAAGGSRALDNIFYILRDTKNLDPMQVIIGDQHIFDYWVADYESGTIRRPECYLWMDMGTRLIYGVAFDKKYSSDTVREALRMGLHRFGAFDCTYNDNGAPETSKAINQIFDDLQKMNMNAEDISEAYHVDNGMYVVEDEDGQVIDTARTPEEWRRKHRRIFANVKNAKAKHIERLFRTIESRLDARHLPGRCVPLGLDIAQEELQQKRLEKQKQSGELLTEDEFIHIVLEELQAYENTPHSYLGMTPWQWLEVKMEAGWKARRFKDGVIDLALFERSFKKVRRGRITLNGIEFIGEDLFTQKDGTIADVGLFRLEGKNVEVRYSRHDMRYAFAFVENTARLLRPVQMVEMLNDEQMVEAISNKRRQMGVISESFKRYTNPIGSLTLKTSAPKVIRDAEKLVSELPEVFDVDLKVETQARINEQRKEKKTISVPFPPIHATSYERFKWCCDMTIRNNPLSHEDVLFMQSYKNSDEYQREKTYWEVYMKLGGDR